MKKALLLSVFLLLAALAPDVLARSGTGPFADTGASVNITVSSDEAEENASEDEAPNGYTLSGAYPNPFQTRTRFQLGVDETQYVTVEVYNTLGQRVRTIFSGLVESGRSRSFSFEARSLPSGLYLYRVEGETFTATRRVALVR